MKNFKVTDRESGFCIFDQEGDGRQWRRMHQYGPYKRKDHAMAMAYMLRRRECDRPDDLAARVMASRVFCAGVVC